MSQAKGKFQAWRNQSRHQDGTVHCMIWDNDTESIPGGKLTLICPSCQLTLQKVVETPRHSHKTRFWNHKHDLFLLRGWIHFSDDWDIPVCTAPTWSGIMNTMNANIVRTNTPSKIARHPTPFQHGWKVLNQWFYLRKYRCSYLKRHRVDSAAFPYAVTCIW